MGLSRDPQRLLVTLGPSTVADALLGRLSGTMEGGRSTDEPNRWVQYNTKGVRLEDWSLATELLAPSESGSPEAREHNHQILRTRKPEVVVAVTWKQVATYGTSVPKRLREEMLRLRRAETAEARDWWEFSTERGGFPHRRRFDSDEAHAEAAEEWATKWQAHLTTSRELHDALKRAVATAMPLTTDDEPVDLLELLAAQPDQEPVEPARSSVAMTAVQRHALTPAPPPCPAARESSSAVSPAPTALNRGQPRTRR